MELLESDHDDATEAIIGCGYSYDHDIEDTGDGSWVCLECGAEGWDEIETTADGGDD